MEPLGLKVELTEHAWVHWRSLHVRDPEGNKVELECSNPAVQRKHGPFTPTRRSAPWP